MNINTSLSIVFFFFGLDQFLIALFAYLLNRKSFVNQILAGLLVLLGLTSLGVGFEMNALTPGQALPWVALEIFSVYAFAFAILMVAIILFVPEIGKKPIIRLTAAAVIVVPLLLLILDLFNLSVNLVGFHFIINVSDFYARYTPGYMGIMEAANGIVHVGLFWLKVISFAVLIFYPLLYVVLRERKTNPIKSANAIILMAATLISLIFGTILSSFLPTAIPGLISNLSFTIAVAVLAIRNAQLIKADGRSFDFFKDLRMFNKLLLTVTGIVLPVILFLNFSIYSLLLNNTLEISSGALDDYATSQAVITANEIGNMFHSLDHAAEGQSVQELLETNNQIYQDLSPEQVSDILAQRSSSGQYIALTSGLSYTYPSIAALIDEQESIRDVSLIDTQGGLIAATAPPAQFDYSSSDWWIKVSSQRTAFIGSPIWDEDQESYATQAIFPILDADEQFIGAITATYSLSNILSFLDEQPSSDLYLGINVGNQELISSQNLIGETEDFPTWMSDPANRTRGWDIFDLNQEYVLLVSAPIQVEGVEEQINWQIAAFQPLDTAMTSLNFARNSLLLLSVFILVVSGLASFLVAKGISQPLVALTNAADQILSGEFNVKIDISGEDELGTLAATFNQMTTELAGMVDSLESTVDDRTLDLQHRTIQMETSAKIARQAAEIRDLQTLLNESVNLISSSFGFYHAGIFLLDSANRYAVLQAANSPGGQRMLARGHRLQVGKVGVVGYCAGTGEPRISQDVGADVVYYDNPDMPRTRSELALPLRVRNTIIGVLDVQSTEASAFSRDDIDVLQTLADQIALAIDNVRLLQSSQRALDELQRLYGQQAGQAWRQRISGHQLAYQFTPMGVEQGDQKTLASLQNRPGHKLRKELKFRGQTIGNINLIRETESGHWSEEEQSLVDEILEQTALALENARLVDQIKLRSDQIELLQQVSAISTEILDEEKLLPIIAEKLKESLAVDRCSVVMLTNQRAMLVTSSGREAANTQVGASMAIEEDPITQRLVRNKEVDVFSKVNENPNAQTFLQIFGQPETKTMIFLPIIVRDKTAGYVYLEDSEPDRKVDSEEINLFNQLSTQISTALENIRLFDETANRAERERQVAEITAKIRSSNDPQEILEMTVVELKNALNPKPSLAQDEKPTSSPASHGNGQDGG